MNKGGGRSFERAPPFVRAPLRYWSFASSVMSTLPFSDRETGQPSRTSAAMRWKVGSTLALDVTPASPVKIYCGKSPVFRGSMGRHHDRVVVRIDGRVEG